MIPRPLLLTGCFILPMFAGWALRGVKVSAGNNQAATQTTTAPSNMPSMPKGMDDLATRIWLAEHLPDADGAHMTEIARRLHAMPEIRPQVWHALFSCWFEKAPAAAWDFAERNPELRDIALEEWATLDLTAARAALKSPSAYDLTALVRGTVNKDVVTAFRLIEEVLAIDSGNQENPVYRFRLQDRHFAELASLDPDAATEWMKRLGIEHETGDFEGALLWGRWKKDPAAAREWLRHQEHPDGLVRELASFAEDSDFYRPALLDFIADVHPPGSARNTALKYLLTGLAGYDPDYAAKEAARVIPDQAIRAEVIAEIASMMARTDFAKAWALLDTLPPSVQGVRRVELPKIEIHSGSQESEDELGGPIHYAWGLTSMRGIDSPGQVRSSLLRNLMETDKDEAIRFMDRIPAKDLFPMGEDAIRLWMVRDRDEGVRWLAGKLGHQGDAVELEYLADDIMDVSGQTSLIRSLPEGTMRTVLAMRAAEEMAEADPLAALDFAREASTSGIPLARAYAEWSSNDPVAAMEHLAGDADAPAEAWEEVAEDAFEKNPEATAAAIENLPDSPARDTAIRSVMTSMVDRDPLEAGAWALALGDTAKRKAAMEEVFRKLTMDLRLTRDPATAGELRQQLHDAADLPEAERQQWADRIDHEFSQP